MQLTWQIDDSAGPVEPEGGGGGRRSFAPPPTHKHFLAVNPIPTEEVDYIHRITTCPPPPEFLDLPPALMILASFLHHAKLSSALFAFSARNGLVRLEQIHILLTGSSNHSETTKPEFSPFVYEISSWSFTLTDKTNLRKVSIISLICTHNVMPKMALSRLQIKQETLKKQNGENLRLAIGCWILWKR